MKLYLSTLFLPSGFTKTDVGESTDIKSSFSIFEMAGRIRKIVFNVLSEMFFEVTGFSRNGQKGALKKVSLMHQPLYEPGSFSPSEVSVTPACIKLLLLIFSF